MADFTPDLAGTLKRFAPYLALTAAVVAAVGFRADDGGGEGNLETAAPVVDEAGAATQDLDADFGTSDPAATSSTDDTTSATVGTRSGTPSTRGSASTSGSAAVAGDSSAASTGDTGGTQGQSASGMVDNCDPNTGRIAIPSTGAPSCVPAFSGDNGGATYQGVSADKIKIAVYRAEANPAADAILAAAGADDSEEEARQQYQEWADFYEYHFETYGREVELHFVEASGPADDDAAGRADAIKVADQIGAFGSFGAGGNTAYTNELAARGLMCFVCAVQMPNTFYEDRAPTNWSTLMSSTQLYTHLAEYMGKRLAFKPAQFAGDPVMATQERAFGLLWYELDNGAYGPGTKFFIEELKKYGITLAAEAKFKGYPDLAANQEQARPIIQKMKAAGATTLIMAADPFAPIFFTQEASRQQYYPEWLITGSALTDTTFFARTYDQTQWANAYGLGNLSARLPEEKSDSFRLLNWHYGRGPTAEGGYGVIRSPVHLFFLGVHYAGPNLNPGTFRDGMFNAPPTNVGGITAVETSFGVDLWGYPDFNAFDSVTEIWWDPQARGEDEIGAEGVGMYRFIDGGKRYLPGEHPKAPTKAFQPEGTVTVYEDHPPNDRPPDYPPPDHPQRS